MAGDLPPISTLSQATQQMGAHHIAHCLQTLEHHRLELVLPRTGQLPTVLEAYNFSHGYTTGQYINRSGTPRKWVGERREGYVHILRPYLFALKGEVALLGHEADYQQLYVSSTYLFHALHSC